jgi:hypothetical protein
MGEVSIFKEGRVATRGTRELTELGKTLSASTNIRRIQTSTNGFFRRMVNGEQIGKAAREVDLIVIGALPKVSRTYYEEAYDPDKEATLPDCWSNLGDKPEAAAENPQSATCATCPQNVEGSGSNGKSRACRFQRRVSALLAGDDSGDVYQFNIPAKSLFGKGVGNVHPFESYNRYLSANGESVDTVITRVSFDPDAETMALLFTPIRNLSDDEYDLVVEAQKTPEAKSYTMLTVAAVDKAGKDAKDTKTSVFKETPAPKQKVARSEEPDEEDEAPPVRKTRAAVVEEEDEPPFAAEPVKRAAVKRPVAETPAKGDMAAVIAEWGEED